jgi:hypothetical protein
MLQTGHNRKCVNLLRFYQLLAYKDDVDLEQKLAHWERF